jgi:hypothetical protein
MTTDTLGEAYSLGWRVTARCVHGREDGTHRKSSRECFYRRQLDMETLVWTRARAFPLSRLETRCGSQHIVVLSEPPLSTQTA